MDFEYIYKAYFKDVFLYLRSLSASEEIAEEITQETFVKALKAIDSFDGLKDIRAWLFAIARNTYYTFCKRQKIYADEEPSENIADPKTDFTEHFVNEESAFLIHKFLHDMQEPYKEVFNLRVFGELPFEKIGLLFGKSASWARVTFYRAKKQILEYMEAMEDEKISCNIIKDILPLYVDDVVSDDTKLMVEEHLKCCEECRKEASILKKDIVLPIAVEAQKAEINVLKSLKKQYKNKKVITAIISVVIAIGILCGIYTALVLPENVIPYDTSKIKIEELGGKLYASYGGSDFDGSVGLNPTLVEIDGEKKKVAMFYFYESPWSNLTARFQKEQEKHMVFLGRIDEIDEVYYGKFDDKHLVNFEKLADMIEESELVWKK